jgi:hypothetical protein
MKKDSDMEKKIGMLIYGISKSIADYFGERPGFNTTYIALTLCQKASWPPDLPKGLTAMDFYVDAETDEKGRHKDGP